MKTLSEYIKEAEEVEEEIKKLLRPLGTGKLKKILEFIKDEIGR